MPWTIVKQDDEWCVYKHDADGNAVGDALGCHATEAEAHEQMRALNMKVSEIICEMVWEFKGDYPDVPFAPGVDIEAFRADTDPMFVTLPVAKEGIQSRNGRPFGRKDVERIVQQINSKRPEGIVGHVPAHKRSTHYELPKLRWVGAILKEGTVWGKAWVPHYAADVREFFRDAKRSNARVGTSIYGVEGELGLEDMVLESIDLGHPDRLGVLDLGVVPKITSELEEGNVDDNEKLVAELRSERDKARQEAADHKGKQEAAEKLVGELKVSDEKLKQVAKLVGGDGDVVVEATKRIAELVELRKRDLQHTVKDVIAELVELEKLRPIISAMVGDVDGEGAARERVKALLAQEDVQTIAKALVVEMRGPNALVGGKGKGLSGNWREEYVKNAEEIAKSLGINVGR